MDYPLIQNYASEDKHLLIYKSRFEEEGKGYSTDSVQDIATHTCLTVEEIVSFSRDLASLKPKIQESEEFSDQLEPDFRMDDMSVGNSNASDFQPDQQRQKKTLLKQRTKNWICFCLFFGLITFLTGYAIFRLKGDTEIYILIGVVVLAVSGSICIFFWVIQRRREPRRRRGSSFSEDFSIDEESQDYKLQHRRSTLTSIPKINELIYRFRNAKKLDKGVRIFIDQDFSIVFEISVNSSQPVTQNLSKQSPLHEFGTPESLMMSTQ